MSEVAVSSTLYNLAGNENNRIDFLKSLIIGGVLEKAESLGDVISNGYLNGPARRLRSFINWAKKPEFAAALGVTSGQLQMPPEIDTNVVKASIPLRSGLVVDQVKSAVTGIADISYWVLRYMAVTHPGEELVYTYSHNEQTNLVTITFADTTIETFTATDFVKSAEYLYTNYVSATGEYLDAFVEGPLVTLPDGEAFPLGWPSLPAGWIQDSLSEPATSIQLYVYDVVSVTYSDGRPPEISESAPVGTPTSVPNLTARYYKDTYQGQGPNGASALYSSRAILDIIRRHSIQVTTSVLTSTVTLPGGVVQTTTTNRRTQSLKEIRKTRTSSQNVIHKEWSNPLWFIYKKETGIPDLDVYFYIVGPVSTGVFFPPIPLRYNNKTVSPVEDTAMIWVITPNQPISWVDTFVDNIAVAIRDRVYVAETSQGTPFELQLQGDPGDGTYQVKSTSGYTLSGILNATTRVYRVDTYDMQLAAYVEGAWQSFPVAPQPILANDAESLALDAIYPTCKKAIKKALNAKFDDLMENIEDSKNILDIDYIYAAFGVSLNVKEDACKKYVYKFLKYLMQSIPINGAIEETTYVANFMAAYASEQEYIAWQSAAAGAGDYPPPEPARLNYPWVPWRELSVEAFHEGTSNYKNVLKWAFIYEDFGTGLFKPGAKTGDLWIEVTTPPIDPLLNPTMVDQKNLSGLNQRITVSWQTDSDNWKRITVTGFQHSNHVYKEHVITTSAKQALEDTEESPFLVPLHEDVYRSMSMVDATQMSTACTFLVFNYVIENELEWYQTDWFKVVLFVGMVVLAITVTVVAGPGSVGLLGSASSIGAALGLSGTAALIAGAAINVVAALALHQILNEVLGDVLTDALGPIAGPIVTTLITSILTMGLTIPGGPAALLDVLLTPQGLMSLSVATGNGVADYLKASAQEILDSVPKMMEEMNKKAAELQKKYEEEMGGHKIDPTRLNQYISEVIEKPEQFLRRTLMTGSDIVEATLGSIGSFAEDRLRLELE